MLDSGWYGSGDWERTLGDYEPDPRKFPRGLEELANHVHEKGMKFGLWVEIENAGIESRLFHEHPEWCLPYGGKPWITANRCQLDFANAGRAAMGDCHRRAPGEPVSARLDQDRLQHRCGRPVRPGAERTIRPPAPRSSDGLLRLARQRSAPRTPTSWWRTAPAADSGSTSASWRTPIPPGCPMWWTRLHQSLWDTAARCSSRLRSATTGWSAMRTAAWSTRPSRRDGGTSCCGSR